MLLPEVDKAAVNDDVWLFEGPPLLYDSQRYEEYYYVLRESVGRGRVRMCPEQPYLANDTNYRLTSLSQIFGNHLLWTDFSLLQFAPFSPLPSNYIFLSKCVYLLVFYDYNRVHLFPVA